MTSDADALNLLLNTAIPLTATVTGVIALVDTDTGRAWAVHDNPAGGLCVDSGRAEDLAGADTTVSGPASALLAWLRGVTADAVSIVGDAAAAALLRGHTTPH